MPWRSGSVRRAGLSRCCPPASLEQPPAAVISAELLATAHGVYEASLNGSPVTDSVLNPGWTVYESRLQVQRFDVTEQVRAGGPEIELAAVLGRGWWDGDFRRLGSRG